jgi:hypothetical protein
VEWDGATRTAIITTSATTGTVAPPVGNSRPAWVGQGSAELERIREWGMVRGNVHPGFIYNEDALRAYNVSVGAPAEALWNPATGFGMLEIDGHQIWLGENKASVEAKMGPATSVV